MSDIVSLEGPVELVDGKLLLRIPLAGGGDKLAPFATKISTTDEEYLIVNRGWLKSFA